MWLPETGLLQTFKFFELCAPVILVTESYRGNGPPWGPKVTVETEFRGVTVEMGLLGTPKLP